MSAQSATTIFKGSSINFLGAVGRSVLNFLPVFMLAHTLDQEALGLYYLGLNYVMLLGVFCLLGTENAVIRFGAIAHGAQDQVGLRNVIQSVLFMVLPLSLAVTLLSTNAADFLAVSMFSNAKMGFVLKSFSWYLPFHVLMMICLAGTQAMKMMHYSVMISDLGLALFKALLLLVAIVLGFGLGGAIWSCVAAVCISAVLAVIALYRYVSLQNFQGFVWQCKQILAFSLPQVFASFIYKAAGILDSLMLGLLSTAATVGMYNVSLRIALLGATVLLAFNTMFSPMIADLHHRKQFKELAEMYTLVTRWTATLSLPVFIAIILYAGPLLAVFGQEFVKGKACLMILGGGLLVNAVTGPASQMILMTGRAYLNLISNLVLLAVIVGVDYLLIPHLGAVGAAIGYGSGVATVNIMRLVMTYYLMGMIPYDLEFYKPCAATALAIVVSLLLQSVWPATHIGIVIPQVLVVCIAYAGGLTLFRFNEADKIIFSGIKRRLVGVMQ